MRNDTGLVRGSFLPIPVRAYAAQALGVDHRVLIAQSALETGWGQSILSDPAGQSSHNLFNIKAGSFWNGRTVATFQPMQSGSFAPPAMSPGSGVELSSQD